MAEARDSSGVTGAGGQHAFMPPADFDAPGSHLPVSPPASPDDPVDPADAPLPPSDAATADGPDEQRVAVDQMVGRCLDPAIGFACRALDPDGSDAVGRDEARRIVMRSIADCARKRISDDDDSVRAVMRRVAELSMDALVAHPGGSPVPAGTDLASLVGSDSEGELPAPGAPVPFAVLQDCLAAARATDRQVGFAVFAAGVPESDASTLLGIEGDDMQAALSRIGRRLADSQGRPVADVA